MWDGPSLPPHLVNQKFPTSMSYYTDYWDLLFRQCISLNPNLKHIRVILDSTQCTYLAMMFVHSDWFLVKYFLHSKFVFFLWFVEITPSTPFYYKDPSVFRVCLRISRSFISRLPKWSVLLCSRPVNTSSLPSLHLCRRITSQDLLNPSLNYAFCFSPKTPTLI